MRTLNYYLLLQGKDKGSLIRIGESGESKYNNSTGRWEESDVMDNFYAAHEDDYSGDVWGRIHEFRKKISEEEAMTIVAKANKEIAKDRWQTRELQEELDSFVLAGDEPHWMDDEEIATAFNLADFDYGYDQIDVQSLPEPANILDEMFWSSSTQKKEIPQATRFSSVFDDLPGQEVEFKPQKAKDSVLANIIDEINQPAQPVISESNKELTDLKSYLDTHFNPWFASVFYQNATEELNESVNTDDPAIIQKHYEQAVVAYKKANEGNHYGFVAFALTNDGMMSVSGLAERIAKTLYCNENCGEKCCCKKVEKLVAAVKTQYEKATAWLYDIFAETGVTPQELLLAGIPDKVVTAVLLLEKVDTMSYEDYLSAVKTNVVAKEVKIALLKQNVNLTQIADLTVSDLDSQRKYLSALEFLLNN